MSLPAELEQALRRVLGAERLRTDPADCAVYAYDNSRQRGVAGGVAFPQTEEDVAAIVRACAGARWPLIARGQGSNTVGATVPEREALIVSFEHMSRIEPVDHANRYVEAVATSKPRPGPPMRTFRRSHGKRDFSGRRIRPRRPIPRSVATWPAMPVARMQ